jgi:hypothetical protein
LTYAIILHRRISFAKIGVIKMSSGQKSVNSDRVQSNLNISAREQRGIEYALFHFNSALLRTQLEDGLNGSNPTSLSKGISALKPIDPKNANIKNLRVLEQKITDVLKNDPSSLDKIDGKNLILLANSIKKINDTIKISSTPKESSYDAEYQNNLMISINMSQTSLKVSPVDEEDKNPKKIRNYNTTEV